MDDDDRVVSKSRAAFGNSPRPSAKLAVANQGDDMRSSLKRQREENEDEQSEDEQDEKLPAFDAEVYDDRAFYSMLLKVNTCHLSLFSSLTVCFLLLFRCLFLLSLPLPRLQ